MSVDFSQTYLYKMHRLTNSLDQVFDTALRQHAGIGLSQFTLLLAVKQHQPATQSTIARFLDITPAAVSRQVEVAVKNGWIKIVHKDNDQRTHQLRVTADGKEIIQQGTEQLENHVFDVFADDNHQANLMEHIETLQRNIDFLGKK